MILNPEQQKVVDANERFLFLLAGAGSGKTRVIVERIRRLISTGIQPTKILAITFTRKAANEMRHRVGNDLVHMHTFHQFCYLKLKEDCKRKFVMAEEEKLPFRKDELLEITRYKNSLYRLQKPSCYGRYQAYLASFGLKDFDDLLIDTIHVLQNIHQDHYTHIFVDEFQDTNLLQYELLKHLIGNKTSVLAVGDPDQSIYGFRGASPGIITLYVKSFHAKVYTLVTNYRSTPQIISHANRIIRRNERTYQKSLIPHHSVSFHAYAMHHQDEEKESKIIIGILKYLKKEHIPLEHSAILYRNHGRAFTLQTALHEASIPFQIDSPSISDLGVHLMTIHQAKGLEFEAVIVIGLEQGVLPSMMTNRQSEEDEERRLMFVAITRAKRYLYLSHVTVNSTSHRFPSSQFIRESGVKPIPKQVLNDIISLGDFDDNQRTDG
jgi:DNA helicase-2/ATP-dependent DNA helicase PcrA